MTEDSTSNDADVEASGPMVPRARRMRRRLLIAAPVAVVVVAACVVAGLWWSDRAAADDAAADDAARIAPVVADARAAHDELVATVEVGDDYLEEAATPMDKTVHAHRSDLGEKPADALGRAVEALADVLGKAQPGPAPEPDGLSGEVDGYADALQGRYRHLHGDDRDDARARIADEIARLRQVADDARAQGDEVHSAVDDVDAAAVKVAAAAGKAGAKQKKGLKYASAASKKKLDASVKALQKLSKTTLPVEWEAHADVETMPLSGLGKAAKTYVSAKKAASASEKENTPAPPKPKSHAGGGGGGGPQMCLRYRYVPDLWGGSSQLVSEPC